MTTNTGQSRTNPAVLLGQFAPETYLEAVTRRIAALREGEDYTDAAVLGDG